MKAVIFVWLCFACLTGRAEEPQHVLLCKSTASNCVPIGTGDQKFDARLQRLLVEHQLSMQSLKPEALYIYFPLNVEIDVREQQIRLLIDLLEQERAKTQPKKND